MRGLDPAFMSELKAKNDIVEVIGSYVALEKKGGNYWACCPFHHEKTPSFSVNASEQFYHCFGCGVSGDVIKFVREIESVEFIDAVKILASRAKMSVPDADFDTEEVLRRKKKKDALLNIMLASARFYRKNLYGGKADAHVQYLTDRKIQPSTIKKFGFGASLDFTTLPEFLLDSGYSRQDIIDSGVCAEGKRGSLYDAQAGRLIIPIINSFDEVIAFGGRLLEKSDFAKYKNTKETMIFNKSKTLYNINLLKKLKKVQTIKNVIMVEGYMDTITLYQAGFTNVVASMGTSLTLDQARLVKRYTDNVLVSYDGDFAGQKANSRGIEIFRDENLNVKVVPLPDGMDPDDVVKNLGEEKYRECLDSAMPLIDYKIYSLRKKYDISVREGKRLYVSEALKAIKGESESTVREELLKNLSRETGLSFKALSEDMGSVTPSSVQTEETPLKSEPPEWTKGIPNKVVEASRFIIASKLFNMKYAENYRLREEFFVNEVHIEIVGYINECLLSGAKIRPTCLFEIIDEEDKELSCILDLYSEDKLLGADAANYFKDCVQVFENYMIKYRQRALIEQRSKCTDEEEKKFLLKKIAELTALLK